jgi:peptidoglycan/LPS O-acetylase OafA/YrhL
MNRQHDTVERFYSLDVLRGLAALSVVLYHWQHFFYSGTNPGTFDLARLPLSAAVHILYTNGLLAVDLFFSLSGFVFYWLYSKRIAERAITPSRFALLRFSRLYPLHFATLLIVALGQLWSIHASGRYFIYPDNDAKHFLLNLLFASSWGFERGYSFNGPSWSVSVEVLLYALFFCCCRLFPIRAIVLALFSIIGFLVVQRYYDPIGRGIGSFFLGGCVFLAYQAIIASRRAAALSKWVAILMIGTWEVTIIVALARVDLNYLTLRPVPFLWHFDSSFQWIVQKMLPLWPVLVLFPLTILSLALIETRRGSLGRRVSFLGDISYSTYLLHFPLQLLFSVVVARFVGGDSIYYSPWFMGLFFVVLIVVSLCSFRYLELPAQRLLRQIRPNSAVNGDAAR